MADPFSIISLVVIGLQSANKLYTLVDGIRDSPREIQNVSADSRSICDILNTLKGFLEEKKDLELPPEIKQSLQIALENTRGAVDEVINKIKPFVTVKGELKKSRWTGIKWSYCQKDVKQLGEQLRDGKSTLNLTLAVVNSVKTSLVKSDTTEIIAYLKKLHLESRLGQGDPRAHMVANQDNPQGFDPRMEDLNFAMTRFLETASTSASSPSHLPEISPTDGSPVSLFNEYGSDNDDCGLDRGPTGIQGDIEVMDGNGLTPLFVAAFNANDTVTRLLLERGAKHQAKEPGEFTALHYAAMQANHAFMGRLLDTRGPDFEAFYDLSKYNLPTDPFSDTVFERRALIVRMLLEHGADIHTSSKGFTPLHIAALTAQDQIVNLLLDKGASAKGVTVICAYWGLSPETVGLLLERGANIEAIDSRQNKTALTWIAEMGSPDMIKVLLQHGASVHTQDNHDASALHYAGANARTESVKLLLEFGGDSNLLDSEHRTPLIRLAWAGRFYLAGRWWNPTPKDREKTAVLLLEAGCDPSVEDVHGRAVVHYAASNGYVGVLKVIAANGGNLEQVDQGDSTPLECAQESGQMNVVRYLKRRKLTDVSEERTLRKDEELTYD